MGDFLIELTIWQVKAWIALSNGAACIEIQKHEISDGQRISPPPKKYYSRGERQEKKRKR